MRGTQLSLVLLCAIFAFGFALPFISARDDQRVTPFRPTRTLGVRTDEPRLPLLLEKSKTYAFHVRQRIADSEATRTNAPAKLSAWHYRCTVDRVDPGTTVLSVAVTTPECEAGKDPIRFTCTVLADGSLRDLPKQIDRSGPVATHLELFLGSGLHSRPLSSELPLAVGVRGTRDRSLPSNLWFNLNRSRSPKRVEFSVVSEQAKAVRRDEQSDRRNPARQRGDSHRRIGTAEYDQQHGLLERATLRYLGENDSETTLAIRRVSIENPAQGARRP